jgi:hypothetical protein
LKRFERRDFLGEFKESLEKSLVGEFWWYECPGRRPPFSWRENLRGNCHGKNYNREFCLETKRDDDKSFVGF